MKILLKIILGLYFTFCVCLYLFQDKFIFNPEHIAESYRYRMGEEIEIPLDDNISMNCLLVKNQQANKNRKAILYLHGNRGSIRFGIYQIRTMLGKGCDILIPDYRSYGKTEGEINSEKQLLADAEKAYDFLKQSYKEENIYVVGYSLGSGLASHVASQYNPAHLCLVAPFTSLTDIKNQYLWFVPDFLLKFKLDTYQKIPSINCPISIIHGTEDNIVSYDFSKELKNTFPDKINLVTVSGQGHRRIIFDNALDQTLSNIILNNQ